MDVPARSKRRCGYVRCKMPESDLLIIAGVDISHARLVDLTRLADQARPFYEWVESNFQASTGKNLTLNDLLMTCTAAEIETAISLCYQAQGNADIPFLFDGGGRTYSHQKACYYFFSWLIRDAPQQRLSPLVQRIAKVSGKRRLEVGVEVLTTLIVQYRANVKTFFWAAVREAIIDRLEGSRRSIRGHEKEVIVRTALAVAIQSYFERHKKYGVYRGIEIPDKQVIIHNESYDVSANLLDEQGEAIRRILIAIKTRETEGGGHSHLFSRDILSAINTARAASPQDYLVVVIVAQNWSRREAENLQEMVDHLILFEISPGEFKTFDNVTQNDFNKFIESVFDQAVSPRPSR